MKTYFILLISALVVHSGSVIGQINNQEYEIAIMDKNGTDGNYYFHYSVPDKVSSDLTKINQINKRLGEELSKIADEYTVFDLIEIIDSIGPKIETEIKDEFDLRNLKVMEIGVAEFLKEYLTKKKTNVDRVKIITQADVKNRFYRTTLNSREKSKSEYLSLVLKTKFDSEVLIEYAIYYREQFSLSIPLDSLNQYIKDVIIDSLHHYEMYEMWITKRDSMEMIMGDIIERSFPETNRVIIFDVIIPEEAEKQFSETNKARQAVMEALFENGDRQILLTQELESNKKLSKSEIIEIEKEIKMLEGERTSIKKKAKLLTYDYKL
ncbi:MAG: hypothetical protein ACI837_002152 [Crocinitomicaceae bacterium]|jgi:hypothetical protein